MKHPITPLRKICQFEPSFYAIFPHVFANFLHGRLLTYMHVTHIYIYKNVLGTFKILEKFLSVDCTLQSARFDIPFTCVTKLMLTYLHT